MPFQRATEHKPNLKGVLELGIHIWLKKADAGKLNPHAVEGCFVGYDEEVKGYHVFWSKKWLVTVEHNVYVNKEAILEPGDVMFEGEDLVDSNPNISTSLN